MERSIETEMIELFDEVNDVIEGSFKNNISGLLNIKPEEFKSIQDTIKVIEKLKIVLILMANKIDRQGDVLERLNRFMDEYEHKEWDNKYNRNQKR